MVGQIEYLELRAFHHLVPADDAMATFLLGQQVDRWIEGRRRNAERSSSAGDGATSRRAAGRQSRVDSTKGTR
jgi:hypothetical protein